MKVVVVTGSRDWADAEAVFMRLSREPGGTHFIDGGCETGVDLMVRDYCQQSGRMNSTMWAPWRAFQRKAGPIRNGWMLKVYKPDLVIAFPLPQSRGTVDCMDQAKELKIPVDVIESKIARVSRIKEVVSGVFLKRQ